MDEPAYVSHHYLTGRYYMTHKGKIMSHDSSLEAVRNGFNHASRVLLRRDNVFLSANRLTNDIYANAKEIERVNNFFKGNDTRVYCVWGKKRSGDRYTLLGIYSNASAALDYETHVRRDYPYTQTVDVALYDTFEEGKE